ASSSPSPAPAAPSHPAAAAPVQPAPIPANSPPAQPVRAAAVQSVAAAPAAQEAGLPDFAAERVRPTYKQTKRKPSRTLTVWSLVWTAAAVAFGVWQLVDLKGSANNASKPIATANRPESPPKPAVDEQPVVEPPVVEPPMEDEKPDEPTDDSEPDEP